MPFFMDILNNRSSWNKLEVSEDTDYPDLVSRLWKSLYGWKASLGSMHAPLLVSLGLGFTRSSVDTSFFIFINIMAIYIYVYVDNILLFSNSSVAITGLISKIKCEFVVKYFGTLFFLDPFNQRKMLGVKPNPNFLITNYLDVVMIHFLIQRNIDILWGLFNMVLELILISPIMLINFVSLYTIPL